MLLRSSLLLSNHIRRTLVPCTSSLINCTTQLVYQVPFRQAHKPPVDYNHGWRIQRRNKRFAIFTLSAFVAVLCTGWALGEFVEYYIYGPKVVEAASPTYISREELTKNNGRDSDRVWMSYRGKVYDVTDFIDSHPGGDKILLAAGGDIEEYWALYAFHFDETVTKMLDDYYVADLDPKDVIEVPDSESSGPYANDPKRHATLIRLSKKPFNAETQATLIPDHAITPTDVFFIRNHLPVPMINEKDYMLSIAAPMNKSNLTLDLATLKTNYPRHSIVATITCAGNRRLDMADGEKRLLSEKGSDSPPVIKGLSWQHGAISTAEWTGVRLVDLLADKFLPWGRKHDLGLLMTKLKAAGVQHVQFEGYDSTPDGDIFGTSIPIEWALDPSMDLLLAFEMNGQPISRDHGFPVRAIVPGTIGARQVKWLKKITLSSEESPSYWHRHDYKLAYPSDTSTDWTKLPAILDYPVQSAICEPRQGQTLRNEGSITVKGYAYSGGGRGILSVRLSADGGETWQEAELHPVSPLATEEYKCKTETNTTTPVSENLNFEHRIKRQWAWTLWEVEIPVRDDQTEAELICVARDSSNNVQPETYNSAINIRGLINNSWHRVKLKLKPEED